MNAESEKCVHSNSVQGYVCVSVCVHWDGKHLSSRKQNLHGKSVWFADLSSFIHLHLQTVRADVSPFISIQALGAICWWRTERDPGKRKSRRKRTRWSLFTDDCQSGAEPNGQTTDQARKTGIVSETPRTRTDGQNRLKLQYTHTHWKDIDRNVRKPFIFLCFFLRRDQIPHCLNHYFLRKPFPILPIRAWKSEWWWCGRMVVEKLKISRIDIRQFGPERSISATYT